MSTALTQRNHNKIAQRNLKRSQDMKNNYKRKAALIICLKLFKILLLSKLKHLIRNSKLILPKLMPIYLHNQQMIRIFQMIWNKIKRCLKTQKMNQEFSRLSANLFNKKNNYNTHLRKAKEDIRNKEKPIKLDHQNSLSHHSKLRNQEPLMFNKNIENHIMLQGGVGMKHQPMG